MNQAVTFLGHKLKEKRNELSRTRAEVAEYLDITPQSYGEMESGKINPSSVTLAKLCLYFKCPIHDFFQMPEKYFTKTKVMP